MNMDNENPDIAFNRLVQMVGVFMIPLSVLASALGSQGATHALKAGLSGLGLIFSLVWFASSFSSMLRMPRSVLSFSLRWALPLLVSLGWLIAAIAHTVPWLIRFLTCGTI
jgi:hypothetical protein